MWNVECNEDEDEDEDEDESEDNDNDTEETPEDEEEEDEEDEEEVKGNKKHDNRPHAFLHHGRVMNEFCHRVLSRNVTQSNVLVVSPDVLKETRIAADEANDDDERLRLIESMYDESQGNFVDGSPSGNVVDGGPSQVVNSVAIQEGHATHLLPPKTNLWEWWNSDTSLRRKDASWFLMAYFIPGDDKSIKEESIDEILSPSRSGGLLSEATLTYIVIGVYSQQNRHDEMEISGLTAVQTLLDAKYKVQLLSSSHFGEISQESGNDYYTVDDDDSEELEIQMVDSYHPNHHFKSIQDVKRFLSKGSVMATSTPSTDKSKRKRGRFDALLFATQGLDLAIPSRLSFLSLEGLEACRDSKKTGRCDSKLSARAQGQNVFKSCPQHHRDVKISFDKRKEGVLIVNSVGSEDLDSQDDEDVEIWLGHDDVKKAEAACARKGDTGSVACTTRILKQPPSQPREVLEKQDQSLPLSSSVPSKTNLLFILIDPISRNQFLRSLPKTASLLERLGFTKFEKYTVVGDNSGPNQAALYTGLPLKGGRDGIKNSDSHGSEQKVWLWDALRSEGYATLKSEDACVENSNMVQSLKPQTTHGEQLSRMFCFDFDRPNCLGKDMAAKYLIKYASEFMKVYSRDHPVEGDWRSQPWAAFLSFVDSHEDTMTVISILDKLLFNLLNDINLSNTLVVFLSDHGLHYGPTFQSNGERERAEPILYLHVPETQSEMHPRYNAALRENSKLWTTPFDVHETIMNVMLQRETHSRSSYVGTSLIKKLPKSREMCTKTPGIPHRFCSVLSLDNFALKQCTFMREPPSVLSFYADIPRKNRPSWPNCERKGRRPKVSVDECQVATTCENEVDCMRNEELLRLAKGHKPPLEDPFSLKVCPVLTSLDFDKQSRIKINAKTKLVERHKEKESLSERKASEPTDPLDFDTQLRIKINTKLELIQRHNEKVSLLKRTAGKPSKMPNILFMEIDSLSESAAKRHIPKTLSVLRNHQIVRNEQNKAHCPTGFCSAMFNKTSVVGQNSIPNQLAALSGCADREIEGENFYLRPSLQPSKKRFETWCPKKDVDSPWLFDIVQELGYVTFFGEEFCYDHSPYVLQGNAFELDVDYDLKELFCRISKGVKEFKKAKRQMLYFVDHDTSKSPDPCIDGRSRQELGFEYIRGIWNAYPDTPKFAYLNSLAAHDYSLDLAYQSLGVEAYDDYLSIFLQEMLGRKDAEDTIIVLRSDHGLQGGPSPIDFSFQVEHMHPFNNLIVPEKNRNLSVEALLSNEKELVTGFDLYKTLRLIIDPRIATEDVNMHDQPVTLKDWSYDLINDKVPSDRTCEDAKIPLEYCPCVEERTDLMPYFYVGHAEKHNKMKTTNLAFPQIDAEKLKQSQRVLTDKREPKVKAAKAAKAAKAENHPKRQNRLKKVKKNPIEIAKERQSW